MRVGISVGAIGRFASRKMELVRLADVGPFSSVWFGEAWGSDAVSAAAYAAAITSRVRIGTSVLQMTARPPTVTAMTAATLHTLSDGRFNLGLGPSSRAVVERWHGQPWADPVQRSREYLEVVRSALHGEAVEYQGHEISIPTAGSTTKGRFRLSVPAPGDEIPIYLAALSPKMLELTAESADGWLPVFYSPWRSDVFTEHLQRGTTERASNDPLRVTPFVHCPRAPDAKHGIEELRTETLRYLRIGPHARLATEYGYGDAVTRALELAENGQFDAAAKCIPADLVDEINLIGPPSHIEERLREFEARGAHEVVVILQTEDQVERLASALA